ncbi:hypothetical protein [Nesterenkonia suensis]
MNNPTPDINLNNIPRDDRIERHHAAMLVGYCSSIDARVQPTTANTDLWYDALAGAPFGIIHDTIKAWHLVYRNKEYRPVIDPATIRKEAKQQIEVEQLRHHALTRGPTPTRAPRRMPKRTLRRFQAKGYLTDRNPNDYPDT